MDTFAIISKSAGYKLVVKLVEAASKEDAVLARIRELGNSTSAVLMVSNPIPSEYGTGAAQLFPVSVSAPPPPLFQVTVGSRAVTFSDLPYL